MKMVVMLLLRLLHLKKPMDSPGSWEYVHSMHPLNCPKKKKEKKKKPMRLSCCRRWFGGQPSFLLGLEES